MEIAFTPSHAKSVIATVDGNIVTTEDRANIVNSMGTNPICWNSGMVDNRIQNSCLKRFSSKAIKGAIRPWLAICSGLQT